MIACVSFRLASEHYHLDDDDIDIDIDISDLKELGTQISLASRTLAQCEIPSASSNAETERANEAFSLGNGKSL